MDLEELNRRLAAVGLCVQRVDEADNPVIEQPKVQYGWEDYHHPGLAELRRRWRLEEVIAPAGDEFQQIVLLRGWVHRMIRPGSPAWSESDPRMILTAAERGLAWYCSHYALVTMHCAQALGWPARHIGVDCDHAEGQRSTHHGVTELYCFELDKWVVVDSHFDVHYEYRGQPLNALEIRDVFVREGPGAVEKCVGPERRRVASSGKAVPTPGYDEAGCYFWLLVRTRNNYFSQPPWQGNQRLLLYIDQLNRDKRWYQNRYDEAGQFVGSVEHTGYVQGTFLVTERLADVYPPLGRTHIAVDVPADLPPKEPRLSVALYSLNPNLAGFEVQFDGRGPFLPTGRRIDWPIHEGPNHIAARAVNHWSRRGRTARLSLWLARTNDR